MRFQPLVLTAILFLFSCNNNEPHEETLTAADTIVVDTMAVLQNMKSNLNIQTNNFMQLDSSGIVMFPLSAGETERYDGSLNYKELPANSYWNIIFYNSKSGDYHLLGEKKMIIGNIDYKYNSNDDVEPLQNENLIFYRVTIDDYNKDKKLTHEDPVYLFTSDKEGNNFKQISPANYHVKSWQEISSSNKILMTLTKDNNDDKKFAAEDEVVTFEYMLQGNTEAKEVFSASFKNKLKILFDRDWKRLKK